MLDVTEGTLSPFDDVIIFRKDAQKLHDLIFQGYDVNALNGGLAFPLHSAVNENAMGMVVILLDAGAKVDVVSNTDKRTALHYAAIKGLPDIAGLLVAYHANPNAADNEANTPLHCAIGMYNPLKDANLAVIRCLIKADADQNIVNKEGLSAKSMIEAIPDLREKLENSGAQEASHSAPRRRRCC